MYGGSSSSFSRPPPFCFFLLCSLSSSRSSASGFCSSRRRRFSVRGGGVGQGKMGRAKRWLRGLLRGKKPSLAGDNPKPAKENRGWGFARSFRDVESQNDGDEAAADMVRKGAAFWEGSPRPHVGAAASAGNAKEDQSKRAIAMAAATAAVAEAAVAAAQAAAAVVRLTGGGRCPGVCVAGRNAELWAAIKIQAAFRGYLARRALRALRGLVKLQALVRGHIVRKQAAETLRCMQALLRVQARARASRALSENRLPGDGFQQIRLGPTTPLKYECPSNYRAAALKHDGACNDKAQRCAQRSATSRAGNADTMDAGRGHCWNWLDRWMEERFSESGVEASSRADVATDEETSDKILEVDTGKPHLIPRRRPGCHSPSLALASDLTGRIFAAAQESSPINSAAVPSPTSVDLHRPLSPMRPPAGDATPEAYESPLLCSASSFSRPGSERRGPLTPAKSECSRSLYGGFAEFPSYMANTESSRAKFRSLSAPRLRPVSEKAASAFRQVPVVGTGCGHWSASSQKAAAAATGPPKFARRGNALSGRLDSRGLPVRR